MDNTKCSDGWAFNRHLVQEGSTWKWMSGYTYDSKNYEWVSNDKSGLSFGWILGLSITAWLIALIALAVIIYKLYQGYFWGQGNVTQVYNKSPEMFRL